jgi:formylglycine-generating enzyme required for sulfatase activity
MRPNAVGACDLRMEVVGWVVGCDQGNGIGKATRLRESNMNQLVQSTNQYRALTVAGFPLRELGSGIEPLVENQKDGSILLLVPSGEFLAGEEKFSVDLPAYYLAMHPVTNAQYVRFLWQRSDDSCLKEWMKLDSGCSPARWLTEHELHGLKDDNPAVQVSWYGAQAYCRWAGLRLPSELEWEKGVRGLDGRNFPWGREWTEHKCRHYHNKGVETTCGVWSYPKGCSYWGHYQMSGNVWEWCADVWDSGAYDRYKRGDLAPPLGDLSAPRALRGGSWDDKGSFFLRCACRAHDVPDSHNDRHAFRVARSLT